MTVASDRRSTRRTLSSSRPSPQYRAETEAPPEEVTTAAPSAVETVETVSSVTETPAPPTVSQRRRRGIETPKRRAARLEEAATLVVAMPYGKFTPFVTETGTVDVTKMAGELGSEETASMLVAAGYAVTPKVVEAIAAGKDVPGMTVADRAVLASLMGLGAIDTVGYITEGKLAERESETLLAEIPPDLKSWYEESLSGVTATSVAKRLWPEEPVVGRRRARVGGLGERVDYLKTLGFTPEALVSYVKDEGGFRSEGETGHIVGRLVSGEQAELLPAELKAWYDNEIAITAKVLEKAKERVQRNVAKLKASGKDYERSDIVRIYKNAYPKWSEQYKRKAKELPRKLAYEAKIAAWRAKRAELVPGEAITEITIGATSEEQAKAQADQATGKSCPDTVHTYKVTLKDGSIILVEALALGNQSMAAQEVARAKAEAAGYNVAWVTTKMSWETVYQPARPPTTDVGFFTVMNADGKAITIHAPLDAGDALITEIADAYGLRGKPDTFTITDRATTQITVDKASQILSNAESASGRLYGLMYLAVHPALGGGVTISSDSVPVRVGEAKTAIEFLSPAEAEMFRQTDTYKSLKGTDVQKIDAAYQEYLDAPRIDLPGGWSMLVNSVKDAAGNILIYGFDALSSGRQEEIKNEIEVAATQEGVTAEEVEVNEEEIIGEAQDEIKDETPSPDPETFPQAGITIPITDAELRAVDEAVASGRCVGEVRTYFTVKTWKVKLRDGTVILASALTDTLAREKAEAAGYDVYHVSRMFSWEKPEEVVTEPETEEEDAAPVFSITDFETDLTSQPQFLQNAYAVGGISGYNGAVEVYNDTIRVAQRVYGGDPTPLPDLQALREAYETGGMAAYNAVAAELAASQDQGKGPSWTVLLTSPDLVARVNSPGFQQQYATVLQPAGMSDSEYAVIAPYITPAGIDKVGAFRDDVPGNSFDVFASENVPDETKAQLESGELVLLPYGDYVRKEDFDEYPDVIQDLLLQDGFPMVKQQEDENIAANIAQRFWQNSWDAFFLNSVQIKHGLFSTAVALIRDAVRTDWKAGDRNPMYFAATPVELQATILIRAIPVQVWGNSSLYLTADQADELNEIGELATQSYDKLYDGMQRAQLNWEAEHPLLQPVYPEGALQALGDLKSAKDIPLILSETVMSTMPYTLATLGVSVVGWLAGGPVGVALVAPITFGFTFGVEGHQIYADALENGASREQAANLMKIYGSISAAIETVGDSLFAGALGSGATLLYRAMGRNVADSAIRGAAAQYGWKRLTGSVVAQFLNQASQEGAQQFVHNLAIKTVNENQQLAEGVADAFVAGLIGTAPFILIPAGGQAIRIARGTTAADVQGDIQNAVFRPSDQKSIVDRVLQPLSDLVSAIGNTPAARKVAVLYVRMGHLAMNYAANAAELARVRETLEALKRTTQAIDQEAITRLQSREKELVTTMAAESKDLKSVSQELVNELNSLPAVDKAARGRIQAIPDKVTKHIDALVTQTMQGRRQAVPTEELALGEQQPHVVGTFAKTAADAKVAVDTIRGLPKTTELRLRIAVNDMLYALGRLGDAVVAAPGVARDTVIKAADDLQLKVKKVYDLLKSLPEASKVKLLQTVNAISDFAASAKFAATSSAKVAINEVDYAVTRMGDVVRAAPDVTVKAVTKAITDVDIALKKASDALGEIPDTVSRGLSKAMLDVTMAARDARTYVDMRGQIALNELIYAANRLATAVNESVEAVWMAMHEFNTKLRLALVAARQLPEKARNRIVATARKLEADVKRLVDEKVVATRMTARIVGNDIEYAVQTMTQAIKDTPQNVVAAAIQARNTIRMSLRSNKLLFVLSVRVAYNELDYAVNHLADVAKTVPGVIDAKVQAALKAVIDKANKLNAAVAALTRRAAAVPGKVVETVRKDIATLDTLIRDVQALAIGDLTYHTDRLVDTIRSIPRATNEAILAAANAVDKTAYRVKRQVQQLPEQAREAVLRYVNSAIALSNAAKAAVKSGADLSVLGAKVTIGEMQYQVAQIKDNIQSAPDRAKAAVADMVVTSRVKIKRLPGDIEHGVQSYVDNLRRDIRRAEENRLLSAYYSVGQNVRNAVRSEFGSVIAGRKKLDKDYGPVVDGLTDLLTALLRAVKGTNFSEEVEARVEEVVDAVFSGDMEKTEQASVSLEELLDTVPGLSKKKGRVPPKIRSARDLIRDGGSFIRRNADDITRSILYKVIMVDIQEAERWGDTKVKLEDYLTLLRDEMQRIQEEQTLSDLLSQINWELEAAPEVRKEPPPTLSFKEQRRQDMIQDRVRRLFEACLYRDFIYRDMQSSSKEISEQALRNMQEWLEGVYGEDYLGNIIKEVDEQLKAIGELEGWPGEVVGLEGAVEEAVELERDLATDIEETIREVERILKENEDKPPDTSPPDGVRDLRPPSGPSAGPAVATAVKEEVKTEEEVAEELTEEEKAALEEAIKEKEKELTKEEREALEEAQKKRATELAEEAAKKEADERATRRVRPRPAPGAITRVTRARVRTIEAPELGAETIEMPEIIPSEVPTVEPAIEPTRVEEISPAIETRIQQAIEEQIALDPAIQEQLSVEQQQQLAAQVGQQLALQTRLQLVTQVQLATLVQQQLQTQLKMQPALKVAAKPAVKAPLWLLPPAQALKEAYARRIPILLWRMGALKKGEVWKAVIAPQQQANLLTVIGTQNLPTRPKKYFTGPGSAAKTLQWLGKGPRHKGAADLGVVDVFWGRKGTNLRFSGKGLKTNVGVRMETPTKGITIEVGAGAKVPARSKVKRRIVAASPSGGLVPAGSLVWASDVIDRGVSRIRRVQWYYLPPPYTGGAIPILGPPHGAKNPEGDSPLETLQIIGRPRRAAPTARIDLGFAEARVEKGALVEVIDKQVAPGEPATAQPPREVRPIQTAVEGEPLELEEEPVPGSTSGVTRVGLPKKAPRKKKPLTDWEHMTTLKGFDPYTGKGA